MVGLVAPIAKEARSDNVDKSRDRNLARRRSATLFPAGSASSEVRRKSLPEQAQLAMFPHLLSVPYRRRREEAKLPAGPETGRIDPSYESDRPPPSYVFTKMEELGVLLKLTVEKGRIAVTGRKNGEGVV